MTDRRWSVAIRTTAIFEAAKGVLALAVGVGLASRLRQDVQRLLGRFAAHFDPLAQVSHVLSELGDLLAKVDTPSVLAIASLYAAARFAEAYGLWHARRWALWLGAMTAALFVPFEAFELVRKPGLLNSTILTANLAIVGILGRPLAHDPGPR